MVLIHGAGGSQLSWPVAIRRLSGFRVLAVDLPGHGRSEGIAFQNVEEHSRALQAFLRELGVFSVILVGHSLGAAIALDFAIHSPEQVCGLALLSAAACLAIPGDIFQAAADPGTYPIALSFMKERFFSPKTPQAARNLILQPLERQRNTVLYSDFLAASRADFASVTEWPALPCWSACGKDDLITPASVTRRLSSRFEGAEFCEIPAAGHMLPLEQPAALASGLQRFCSHILCQEMDRIEKKWT